MFKRIPKFIPILLAVFVTSSNSTAQDLGQIAFDIVDEIKSRDQHIAIELLPPFAVGWSNAASEILQVEPTNIEYDLDIFFSSSNNSIADKLSFGNSSQVIFETLDDYENREIFRSISEKMRERPQFAGLTDSQMVTYWTVSNLVANSKIEDIDIDDHKFCIWIIFCR